MPRSGGPHISAASTLTSASASPSDGRVLVAAGGNGTSAELYNPTTGTWSPTGSTSVGRFGFFGTLLLLDGRVLVAGGCGAFDENFDCVTVLASAEIYSSVPGGYDGDGKADIAVYRSSTGEWIIQRSSDGVPTHASWGCPSCGDIAVPADYDGDGTADIAVYRSSTGEWFIQRSSDGQLTHTSWGCPACGDVAVPRD